MKDGLDSSQVEDRKTLRAMKWATLAWVAYASMQLLQLFLNESTFRAINIIGLVATLLTSIRLALRFRRNGVWH